MNEVDRLNKAEVVAMLGQALRELTRTHGSTYHLYLNKEVINDNRIVVFYDYESASEFVYYDEGPTDAEIIKHIRGNTFSPKVDKLVRELVESQE